MTNTALFIGIELTKEELFGKNFIEEKSQTKLPIPLKYFWNGGQHFVGCYLGGTDDVTQCDIAYDDLFVVFVKTTVALRNLGIDRYPHLMFKDVSK